MKKPNDEQGFVETILTTRKYNVICVTKYGRDGVALFHLPADGGSVDRPDKEWDGLVVEIEVKQVCYAREDLSFTKTVVTYQGKDYDLSEFRNGLSGASLVIGIHKDDDEEAHMFWHLYTDTVSARKDRPEEVVTPEELRVRARCKVAGIMYQHHGSLPAR
jgi:hypothetical protein